MFVNHLLFTLRNRIHFSPPSQIFNQTLQVLQTPDGADYTDSFFFFFRNRGMRRTRQTKVLLILQRATALNLFFSPSLMHRKNIPQNLIKISTKSLLFKIFGSWREFDSRIDTEVGSFLFVISLSTPLPSPHVYAKPLHLQICGFLILWNSGISRERARRVRQLTNGGMLK